MDCLGSVVGLGGDTISSGGAGAVDGIDRSSGPGGAAGCGGVGATVFGVGARGILGGIDIGDTPGTGGGGGGVAAT